jgi:pyruvate formate lyase activating enzyme
MKIGSLQRFSLIDYPGKICAIVFTQGCNFRCPYCHNPELVNTNQYGECLPKEEVLSFLERRKGKLDAVNITGGEPALQPGLTALIKKIREMDYLVKIDTNGSLPEVLDELIGMKLIDWIAMDVKAPLAKYAEITKSSVDTDNIRKSISLIMKSGIEYEFRTTIVRSLLNEDDVVTIGRLIKGASRCVLQKFVPSKTVDKNFMQEETFTQEEFHRTVARLNKLVQSVIIR